eukprot:CAMPEP_0179932602 /NCGR_PEP_ID=MMETSP0983-20121128/11361_1 /TAXON_ID=483367 /ORGANISM="non described non described, Strain CCMP 2436" /LENGTH=101 /DNA_ID=CAMNT_0021837229 /DNA_START=947 /DNA_END=1248 /DNA_ORIENTATION=+
MADDQVRAAARNRLEKRRTFGSKAEVRVRPEGQHHDARLARLDRGGVVEDRASGQRGHAAQNRDLAQGHHGYLLFTSCRSQAKQALGLLRWCVEDAARWCT